VPGGLCGAFGGLAGALCQGIGAARPGAAALAGFWLARNATYANTFDPKNRLSGFRQPLFLPPIWQREQPNSLFTLSRFLSRISVLFVSDVKTRKYLKPLEITPLAAKSSHVPIPGFFVFVKDMQGED